jgi:hypothetical protein
MPRREDRGPLQTEIAIVANKRNDRIGGPDDCVWPQDHREIRAGTSIRRGVRVGIGQVCDLTSWTWPEPPLSPGIVQGAATRRDSRSRRGVEHSCDISSRKPRGDRAVPSRVDPLQDATAVAHEPVTDDQTRLLHQAQLPAHREPTQLQHVREPRRSGRADRERGDQSPARGVREQLDSGSVSMRHGAITMSRDAQQALTRAGGSGAAR